MGRKNRDPQVPTNWDTERSLADAESESEVGSPAAPEGDAPGGRCVCGHDELLLQAYFAVRDGRVDARPLEVEGLTCPECGREFEAVLLEDGRVVRGEFVGWADDDDGDA